MITLELPNWILNQLILLENYDDLTIETIIRNAIVYYLHNKNFGPVLGPELQNIERRDMFETILKCNHKAMETMSIIPKEDD